MIRLTKIFAILFFTASAMICRGQSYSIDKFGAVADGKTINTKAIQSAIDKCAQTGGEVIIPQGIFVSGTLYLKSNVTLNIAAGGTLKGSDKFADYPDNNVRYKNAFTHGDNGISFANKALIFAEGVENISITGKGTIDGSGDAKAFDLGNDNTPPSRLRPCMLLIIDSKKIAVTGLTMRNSAYWLQNYLGCSYLELKGLTIFNHTNYNQDGMDIDASHVLVENCVLDVDDDGICFKSHDDNRPVTDVVVRNCRIASNCNAIKFGTMSRGGFKNFSISHCQITAGSEDRIRHWQQNLKFIGQARTAISGIALESVDAGVIEAINIADIDMRGVQTPIFVVLGKRARKQAGTADFYNDGSAPQRNDPSFKGSINNITFKNITATAYSKMASSFTAFPGYYITNVHLSNIRLNDMGAGTADEARIVLPETPGAYPENRKYGLVYPASGLFVRHVKNLYMDGLKLSTQKPDYRPVIILDDVVGSKIKGLSAGKPMGDSRVLSIVRSADISLDGVSQK